MADRLSQRMRKYFHQLPSVPMYEMLSAFWKREFTENLKIIFNQTKILGDP